jgi:ArsR family metal-binding transcriptional regulator
LVDAITLMRLLPCLTDPGKIIVIGETDAAIDDVLPHNKTVVARVAPGAAVR